MTFLKGKWIEIEKRRQQAIRYGENTKVVNGPGPVVASTPQPHSFSHLIGVKFTIPTPNWKKVADNSPITNIYAMKESPSVKASSPHE